MTQEKKKSRPNSKGRQEHRQQQAEKSNANSKLEMNRTSTANRGIICGQAEGRKKTWKERCQCTEVNVYVVYILSTVKTENTYTPARLEALF